MIKPNDYEVFFDEIGISDEEERNVVLGFIRELFEIAIQHLNNEKEMAEAWV